MAAEEVFTALSARLDPDDVVFDELIGFPRSSQMNLRLRHAGQYFGTRSGSWAPASRWPSAWGPPASEASS
jgi:hypothetical protein